MISASMELRLRFVALCASYTRDGGLRGPALAEHANVRGLLVELVASAAPSGTDAQRAAIARNVLGPGPVGLRENLIRAAVGLARVRGPQLAALARLQRAKAEADAAAAQLDAQWEARRGQIEHG